VSTDLASSLARFDRWLTRVEVTQGGDTIRHVESPEHTD
jgi:hypothetical protein